jgi:hypothetical protein
MMFRVLKLTAPDGKKYRVRAYFQIRREIYTRGMWNIERTTLMEHEDGSSIDKVVWTKKG